MSLPNRDELAVIDEEIKLSGALPIVARAAAIEAFDRGEMTSENACSWFARAQSTLPDLWPSKQAVQGATDELLAAAFVGRGSVTKRGELVKLIGESAAADAAKEYGLRNLHDYQSIGKAPVVIDDGKDKKPADKHVDNPWSAAGWNITKQGQLLKVIGADKATQMAKSVGSFVGATKPAAKVA